MATEKKKKVLKKLNKKEKKDLKARYQEAILNCQEHRLRDDKEALTDAERLDVLKDIYDASLFWTKEIVSSGILAGTGAVTTVLERVGNQIEKLSNVETNNKTVDIKILFKDQAEEERGENE